MSCFKVFTLRKVTEREFVEFWSNKYLDVNETVYSKYIDADGRRRVPLSKKVVLDLFKWKNGTSLSQRKLRSIREHFLPCLPYLNSASPNCSFKKLLAKLPRCGFIWTIFLLHILRPNRFPIFDQHVYRAMMYINTQECKEIKQQHIFTIYEKEYLPFYRHFHKYRNRLIDKALWAFGKFLKLYCRTET